MLKLIIGCLLFCVHTCHGHGRLSVPTTRDATNGVAEHLQNAPVSSLTGSAFVCRDQAAQTTRAAVTAGSPLSFEWTFSAAHIGDCFLYVSYDTGADTEKEWFKISNFLADETPPRDCRLGAGTPYSITVPDWLPAGNAVFRWEWYALHQRGGGVIEYYSQCFDVTVTSTATTDLSTITPKVSIGSHLPSAATSYRDGFSPSCEQDLRTCTRAIGVAVGDDFLVGPALATADGQTVPSPTSSPSAGTSPTSSPSTGTSPTSSLSTGASPVTPSASPSPAVVAGQVGVCSRVYLKGDCSGLHAYSDCVVFNAASCDTVDSSLIGLPARWSDIGADVEPNPPFPGFDTCHTSGDGLSFSWHCGSATGEEVGGEESEDNFGTGFGVGFVVFTAIGAVGAGCLICFARSRRQNGSPLSCPSWTGFSSSGRSVARTGMPTV